MGTDIHTVWQKKNKDGSYTDVKNPYNENRHYYLFAWLGNVRNGFGFAGIKTHEPLTPLSDCRGLPADFELIDDEYHPTKLENYPDWCLEYYKDGEPTQTWMGNHSHGWLTWDEIINGKQPVDNIKTGIITLEEFTKWDKKSPPETYCGAISGPEIIVANNINSITANTTHVRVHWVDNQALQYFIDIVQDMKNKYGEGRLVFGFDS